MNLSDAPYPGFDHSEALPPRFAPPTALAWSEARVDDAEGAGGPHLALWRPEGTTVAVGIGQTPSVELEVEAMRRDGVELVRRQSGGGAVLLYEGVLCWEAWAGFDQIAARSPDGSGIRSAYRVLCAPVVAALGTLGIPAFHAGICDISFAKDDENPRKLAGTAQLRRKDRALVHGSLLVCPELEKLAAYLKFPSDQPDYRRDRSHRDFCVSVAELAGTGEGGDDILGRVSRAVGDAAKMDGWRVLVPSREDGDSRMAVLERDKYRSEGWNWERKRPSPA